jgi:acyl-CoA hydrolase
VDARLFSRRAQSRRISQIWLSCEAIFHQSKLPQVAAGGQRLPQSQTLSNNFTALLDKLRPGARIFIHAGPSESLAFRAALTANPERAAGVEFVGVFITGVNDFDYAGLHSTARLTSSFTPPRMRASFEAGRATLTPLHYSELGPWIRSQSFDLAVLHCPPERGGMFSLGLNADVALAAARRAREVAVIVNPQLPWTVCREPLPESLVSLRVDSDGPLLSIPADRGDAASEIIAGHVAGFVRDGDTIQTGIGRIPGAVLRKLTARRELRLYGGMLSDEIVELAASGAFAAQPLICGQAIGSRALWDFAREANVIFCSTDETHDPRRLMALDNFVAVNSAVEVDLFGQVNGEIVNGRQISGIGGSSDFARAARWARNGRSIIALPASARGKSRVTPLIAGPVSQARCDADIVVTEYGVAEIRHASLDARAEQLIAIAAPEHRAMLTDAWRDMRAKL